MGDEDDIGNSWRTTEGKVINPNAPAGAGGAGSFRDGSTTLGTGEPFVPALPSPDSPAARYLDTPDPLQAGGTTINPPPATPTGVTSIKKVSDANNDIDVMVEVLADGVNSSEPGQAHTKLDPSAVSPTFPNIFVDDTTKRITKLTSKFILKGTATIQIRYKPGTDKAAASAYGRGTTLPDKTARDMSVGFHEVSHVRDMLAWMKSHPLPEFTTKAVGMTESQFDAATAAYSQAIDDYFAKTSDNSHAVTDEVGSPTRSQWLAANKTP